MLTVSQLRIKRCLDTAITLPIVLLTWPICLLLIIAATIDTGSWGLYSQRRIGRLGRPFRLFKIRTMVGGPEGGTVTVAGDERITPLGSIMRQWKLDELPQLWQVLSGALSLVGPRPDVAGLADALKGDDRIILEMPPGITGPASLRWRHEESVLAAVADPAAFSRHTVWPDKVRCNLEYIKRWSPWLDLRLLAATVLPAMAPRQWSPVRIGDPILGTNPVSDSRGDATSVTGLLGRATVPAVEPLLHGNIKDQVVLVTGAGGSIGSELCRQIVSLRPACLILLERCEYALYQIHHELAQRVLQEPHVKGQPTLVPLLGCAGNYDTLSRVFSAWSINTVYHAAAHKHVPIVEANVAEGVLNNSLSTWRTAEVAQREGVATFVLISTDKAVRPTSVMGASKRLAEMVIQAMMQRQCRSVSTRFSIVRFGNVLGSSGSVVPLFREQIRRGGPVTITHPDVTRFFMTVEEAVQLVIQAGCIADGGEVHVLDMGPPVRILDLAHRMIRLSGHEVMDERRLSGSIEITFTGLRPGEKLYEELIIGNDLEGTVHPRILRGHEAVPPWEHVEAWLTSIEQACAAGDCPTIRAILNEAVEGYRPESEILDLVWKEADHSAETPLVSATNALRP